MTAREDREKEKTSRENLGKFFYSFGLASTAILAYVGFRILKKNVMEGLIMIYATITVVAGAMALWLHTNWGKKFLENL